LSQAEETSFSRVAFVAALGAFLLIGSTDAAYGPLLRPIATRFGVSLPAAGTVISVYFVGALVSVPVVLAAFRRGSPHRVAVAALAVLAVGCLAISLAGGWLVLLAAVLVSGLGFGATDFGLNQIGARTAADGRAARLTILNAAFGAGAVLGPVIVSQLGEQALTAGFAAAAGLACVLAIGLRGIRGRPVAGADDLAAGPVGLGPLGDVPLPPRPDPPSSAPAAPAAPVTGPAASSPGPVTPGPGRQPAALTRRRGLVALAGLGYLLYVACETSVAGWIPAQLASVGYHTSFAAGVTSGFWAAMTVGRLLIVPVSRVVPARRIVLAACVLLLAVLTLTALPAAAPAAYIAAGLAAAPIFPVGLAWVGAAFPGQPHATSWALTGSLVGGVTGPAVVAAVVSVAGLPAVPAVLSALAAGSLLVFLAIWRVAAE
jgi:MFS transporter, FHS family, glucose/mannose:H+ symporter